jgi:hypothetical protein
MATKKAKTKIASSPVTQSPAAEPKPAAVEQPNVITQAIFKVMDDIALEERDLGRLARKLKRMKRDGADKAEQLALLKPLFTAIGESIMSEPIDRDETTGMMTLPVLKLPRDFLKTALKKETTYA